MNQYLIIGIAFSAIVTYIVYLKYDNKILEEQLTEVKSMYEKSQTGLQLQKELTESIKKKNEKMVKDILELEKEAVALNAKKVKVENCNVDIINVDTNASTAKGIPLFLGNIGK